MAANPRAEILFREMISADLPRVMEIESLCCEFPWTEGNFRDCLLAGYYCCVVLSGAELAGYAILSIAAGEAHVLNLCVRPELQGRGIGTRMVGHLFDRAREGGAGWMLLEVRKSNARALALYQRAGFVEVGLRRSYYPGRERREDAIVLSCAVRPASGT